MTQKLDSTNTYSNCTCDLINTSNHSNTQNSFKLISTNFRGLRSKKDSFMHLILSESPNFIAGTETWLNSNVYNNEIFPQDYQVFRVDRADGHGGVLFVCHKTINCVQIPLHSQCAFRINLSDGQTLIILTLYRPPNREVQYMENICKVIEYLCIENAVLWVTGDFNLPNIDWRLYTTTRSTYPVELCDMLIESFNTFGLTQMFL